MISSGRVVQLKILPRIIVLNGTSSAGKTALAHRLQELLLPSIYLNYSIDSVLYTLPPSVLKRMTTGQDLSDLDYWSLVRAYYHSARALALQGQCLILDDAVTLPAMGEQLKQCLEGLPFAIVGVHCELETVKRRELERGDRAIGEAERQYGEVHRHLGYDLAVDSTSRSPDSLAAEVVAFLGQSGG
jgi:chloramphenicol 3-O phosphotransferase